MRLQAPPLPLAMGQLSCPWLKGLKIRTAQPTLLRGSNSCSCLSSLLKNKEHESQGREEERASDPSRGSLLQGCTVSSAGGQVRHQVWRNKGGRRTVGSHIPRVLILSLKHFLWIAVARTLNLSGLCGEDGGVHSTSENNSSLSHRSFIAGKLLPRALQGSRHTSTQQCPCASFPTEGLASSSEKHGIYLYPGTLLCTGCLLSAQCWLNKSRCVFLCSWSEKCRWYWEKWTFIFRWA